MALHTASITAAHRLIRGACLDLRRRLSMLLAGPAALALAERAPSTMHPLAAVDRPPQARDLAARRLAGRKPADS